MRHGVGSRSALLGALLLTLVLPLGMRSGLVRAASDQFGYQANTSGRSVDGQHAVAIALYSSDTQVYITISVLSGYGYSPGAQPYASTDNSYTFSVPIKDLQARSGVLRLDTGTDLGSFGHLAVDWSFQPSPRATSACTSLLQSAPPIPARTVGALQMRVPHEDQVLLTLDDRHADVTLPHAPTPAEAAYVIVRRGPSALPHDSTIRRLDTHFYLAALQIDTRVGPDKLDLLLDSGPPYTGSTQGTGAKASVVELRLATQVAVASGVLLQESYGTIDLLTTANSTFQLTTDLSGQVRYHGPYASVDLHFQARHLKSQIQAGSQGISFDPCTDKPYHVSPVPDLLLTDASLASRGSLTLPTGVARQTRFSITGVQGSGILERPSTPILRMIAVSPADKAMNVPRNAPICLTFNTALRKNGIQLYLFAGDDPDPTPLGIPRYDPATHVLTVQPRRPLRPHTHYLLRIYGQQLIFEDANGGESPQESITYFTTGA